MTKVWIALAAMLLLAPLAQGHASPNPLNVDQHLLADDSSDSYALYDGFDLQDLYVRESYVDGQEGLTFRMVIYGGFSPAKVAANMHLDLTITTETGDQTFRVSSTDGLEWDGDAQVLESSLEAESDGAIAGALQVFIPLSDLGVAANDTVGPFLWKNFADADLRDIAPGGTPVPGTNGEGMVPGTSTVMQETVTLAGPIGYTSTSASRVENTFSLTVENLITPIGQHIILELPDAPGWTIERIDTNAKVVEVGQHPTFEFTATPSASAQAFDVEILTDLGGREVLTIQPTGAPAPVGNETETPVPTEEPTEGKDSPGGLWLAPLALAAAAILRRR